MMLAFKKLRHETPQLQVQITNQPSEPICSLFSGVQGPEGTSKGCLVS